MRALLVAAAALSSISLAGCGALMGNSPPPPKEEAPPASSAGETTASADTAPPADSGPVEPPAPKKKTKAELEEAMGPPAGLLDLRPIVGTDPDSVMPAVFANVKKGMTAKELDADFPGVGAVKVPFVTFTKSGKRWIRVKGTQAHKEVLDIAYADDGALKRIGYMFDPASVNDALWEYLKKAAQLRWGDVTDAGDRITWSPGGVKEISIHKVDARTLSIDVEL